MKRCSQCDFLYEDDQQLCDMDGHELVYEPTFQSLQVNAAAPATKPSTPSVKSRGRRLVLLAATAALIGTVLSVGYSGFTSEYVPQNSKGRSTKVIRATPNRIKSCHLLSAPPAVSPTPRQATHPGLTRLK